MREIFVESAAGMAYDSGAAVWSFDLGSWGTCVQAPAVEEAVQAFERAYGPAVMMERIGGDEQAFLRDRAPASDTELAVTLETLRHAEAANPAVTRTAAWRRSGS